MSSKSSIRAPFPVRRSLGEGGSQQGGLGRALQLFGPQLPALLEELNEALVA